MGTFSTYHLDVEENDMYIANDILTHNAAQGKTSDIRLKENIIYIGVSQSGIPIYIFSYIGCAIRYIGTMAQDLLRLGRNDAVSISNDGYYKVYYCTGAVAGEMVLETVYAMQNFKVVSRVEDGS